MSSGIHVTLGEVAGAVALVALAAVVSYWRKAGLVVRAGSPQVTVTVPKEWRHRAAIT